MIALGNVTVVCGAFELKTDDLWRGSCLVRPDLDSFTEPPGDKETIALVHACPIEIKPGKRGQIVYASCESIRSGDTRYFLLRLRCVDVPAELWLPRSIQRFAVGSPVILAFAMDSLRAMVIVELAAYQKRLAYEDLTARLIRTPAAA